VIFSDLDNFDTLRFLGSLVAHLDKSIIAKFIAWQPILINLFIKFDNNLITAETILAAPKNNNSLLAPQSQKKLRYHS
jgi:hypothetical protein